MLEPNVLGKGKGSGISLSSSAESIITGGAELRTSALEDPLKELFLKGPFS